MLYLGELKLPQIQPHPPTEGRESVQIHLSSRQDAASNYPQDPKDVDQARLDRVLQGARPNHPIVLKLLQKRTQVVPTYPELIREVREEEALLKRENPKIERIGLYCWEQRESGGSSCSCRNGSLR